MPNTLLSTDQVLLEALNKWRNTKKTTRNDPDAFYSKDLALRPFTALDALMSIAHDTEDDVFWQTANIRDLERQLIDQIDGKLAPTSNYKKELELRLH